MTDFKDRERGEEAKFAFDEENAFKIAARSGLQDALAKAGPVLLEPIHQVTIAVPSEATSKVHGILSSRRGQILGFDAKDGWPGWDAVTAYLPEAETDYILAIIGEELGLLGTLVVILLFGALAVGLFRVIRRHRDPFVQIATGGIAAWILGQALINIGVVVNLLPVIGVPLPLVSAGGSSLVATMLALGIVLAFARDEPGARRAATSRSSVVARSLAVLGRGGRG